MTITVQADYAIAGLDELAAKLKRPRAMLAACGREAANRLKAHFRDRDRQPNKLGGRRSHFWLGVSRSVQSPVMSPTGTSVTVSINHPAIAQKLLGGVIVPKRARALTIPVSPEAYGRFARHAPADAEQYGLEGGPFEEATGKKLFLIRTSGAGVLASKAANSEFLEVHYVLAKRAVQRPDPEALPAPGPFAAAILRRAESVVQRQTQEF